MLFNTSATMKKSPILFAMILASTLAQAGFFKPSKPDLLTDDVLVPEKQYVVKMFKVKQLADIEYSKNNKKIKGADKKVAVPFYTVKFPKKHYLNRSEFEKKGGVNIATEILGVSEQTYKKITDWGYKDLLNKLQENGFEVTMYDDIISNEKYQNLKTKKEKIKKGYSQYNPEGMRSIGNFTSFKNVAVAMSEFKADAINVTLTLDPMARQRDQTKFVTKKTKVGQSAHVSELLATINSLKDTSCHRGQCFPKYVGTIKFINPIHSDIPFAHVEDDTNTKANVAGHVVTGLLRLGGARAKTNYTFKYKLNADEEKYIEAAKDALGKTNDKLVDELNKIY